MMSSHHQPILINQSATGGGTAGVTGTSGQQTGNNNHNNNSNGAGSGGGNNSNTNNSNTSTLKKRVQIQEVTV